MAVGSTPYRFPATAVQIRTWLSNVTLSHLKLQVEQVLETYFMNLDNTYNKLQTLAEYVDDTEDYIKFEIDTQRNRFIEVRSQPVCTDSQGMALHCIACSLLKDYLQCSQHT
jgi:hypothetical protein